MKISILLFGIARDIVGERELEISIHGQQNVAGLLGDLKEKYPDFNNLKSVLVAVNNDYAEDTYILQEKDEIAIIPPVSGG